MIQLPNSMSRAHTSISLNGNFDTLTPPYAYYMEILISNMDSIYDAGRVRDMAYWGSKNFEIEAHRPRIISQGRPFDLHQCTAVIIVQISGMPDALDKESALKQMVSLSLGYAVVISTIWRPVVTLPSWTGGYMPDDWCAGCGRSIQHLINLGKAVQKFRTDSGLYCDVCNKLYGKRGQEV